MFDETAYAGMSRCSANFEGVDMKSALAVSLLIIVVSSGCRDAGNDNDQRLQTPQAQVKPTSTIRKAPNVATIDVTVRALPPHGRAITDGDGRALYAFSLDQANQSNCSKRCAEQFPPKLKTGIVNPGPRISSDRLNSTVRQDGSRQITFFGRPLYYFVADKAKTRSFGQGVQSFGGTWHLVRPDGSLVQGSPQL